MLKRVFNDRTPGGLDKARLVSLLGMVFVAITVLTAALVYYAHSQVKWQSFHQYRGFATSISNAIESQLSAAIATELQRPVTQYQFDTASAGYADRSELSQLGFSGEFASNLGYFQVDSSGQFSTPLLPHLASDIEAASLASAEWEKRESVASNLVTILGSSSLVSNFSRKDVAAFSSPAVQARRRQSQITSATVEALELDEELSDKSRSFEQREREPEEGNRKASVESRPPQDTDGTTDSTMDLAVPLASIAESEEGEFPRVTTFNSTPAPFEFNTLDSGHFVLFRRVVIDREAVVQGLVLQQERFLETEIGQYFLASTLSQWGRLLVVLEQNVIASFNQQKLSSSDKSLQSASDLLYEHRLGAPFNRLRLVYSLEGLPASPAGGVLLWVSIALVSVLCCGFYALYRAGLKQIELSRQQQNFVASVTHELKTPLTSIRMYGEMLQSGWVSDDKRQEYYRYIHDESQRLSRLVANVLQLSNLGHESLLPELELISTGELIEEIKAVLHTHLESSDALVEYSLDPTDNVLQVRLDRDAWAQVVINLVDNAIKFSSRRDDADGRGEAGNAHCRISISISQTNDGHLAVAFRDFGPGIPDDERKKIFDLFYRPENELLRQTTGTGIGLAIVRQLLNQMHGGIDVFNANPGARFCVTLPLVT